MGLVVIEENELKGMISSLLDEKLETIQSSVEKLNEQMMNNDELVSPKDVKERYGASLFMQAKWRREGLVNFQKIGVKKIYYQKRELLKFFKAKGNIALFDHGKS